LEKLGTLKPVFGVKSPQVAEPSMTAGNSTPLSDGASSVLMGSAAWAAERGLTPLARVVDARSAAVDFVHGDEGLLMAPVYAVPELLDAHVLTLQDLDFYEIHEAFASTVLTTLKAWESEEFCRERLGRGGALGSIDRAKLNVAGSSLAAGHPFAATGGRLVATLAKLLHERAQETGRIQRGLISVCAAAGQGTAVLLESVTDWAAAPAPPPRDRTPDQEVTMTDAYPRFIRSAPGGALATQLGLPRPARLLRRDDRPAPVLGPVVVLGDSAGADGIAQLLLHEGHDVRRRFEELRSVGSVILVLDEIASPADLGPLVLPLAGAMRSLAPGARVVTISRPAGDEDPARDAARGGVEGFLRSLAHEMRGGATANGLLVEDDVALEAPS